MRAFPKESLLNFRFPEPIRDIDLLDRIEEALFEKRVITAWLASDLTLGEFLTEAEAYRDSEMAAFNELYGEDVFNG